MKTANILLFSITSIFLFPGLCFSQSSGSVKNKYVVDVVIPPGSSPADVNHSFPFNPDDKADAASSFEHDSYHMEIKGKKYPFSILKRDTINTEKIQKSDGNFGTINAVKYSVKWTIKFEIPDLLTVEKSDITIVQDVVVHTGGKQSNIPKHFYTYGKFNNDKLISIALNSNPQGTNYFLIPYGEWILSGSDFWLNKIKEYAKAIKSDINKAAKMQDFFNKKGILTGSTSEKLSTNKLINYKVISEYNGKIILENLNLMNQQMNREMIFDFLKK